MNGWYKIAQEYTGADATLTNGSHIQPFVDRLESKDGGGPVPQVQSPFADGTPYSNLPADKSVVPTKCTVCSSKLSHVKGPEGEISWGFYNDDGSMVYKCKNCGFTNNQYKILYSPRGLGQSTRLKHRRKKSSQDSNIVVAAAPYNPPPPSNPANTPYGRFDFSTDVRVIPWDVRVDDDFQGTWDTTKQKKKVDYKFKKVKDKSGQVHFVKVVNPAKGTGVQPANTYNQKGDIKKQPRYDNKDGVPQGNSSGSWPHNRSTEPSTGWYQADYVTDKNRFDSDMRERVVPWEDWIANRNNETFTLSKPF
jgi:hypothetical protein